MPSTPDHPLLPRMEELERDVAELAAGIARLRGSSSPPVWSWLGTDDPDSARTILTDLVEWVHRVWLAWPDARGLPPCWIEHAFVVEELWALRNSWAAHEKRGGTWAQRLDWIERYRPAAAKRIASYFGTHRHEDPVPALRQPPSMTAIEHAADQHCEASTTPIDRHPQSR